MYKELIKHYRMGFIWLLLLYPQLGFSETLKNPSQTWSDYLSPIENSAINTSSNLNLIHSENQLTNQALNKSKKNRDMLKAILKNKYSSDMIIQTLVLVDKSELQLVDHGVGKATELMHKIGQDSTSLISNLSIKKNNTVAFISFTASPDGKIAIIFSEKEGSIDDYRLFVINLSNGQLISSDYVANGNQIIWTGPEKFSFKNVDDYSLTIEVDIQNSFAKKTYANTNFAGAYPVLLKCQNNIQTVVIADKQTVTLEGIGCYNWSNSVQRKADKIVLITRGDNPQLLRFTINPEDQSVSATKIFEWHGILQSAQFIDDHYFIASSWGVDQKLYVLDIDGKLVQELTIPSFVSIKQIKSKTAGKSITLILESQILTDQPFEYDYSNNSWDKNPTPENMLQKDGNQYVSEVILIPTRDGTIVPTRLAHLKNLALTPNVPSLIYVYGGFKIPGKLYPQYDYFVRELFIKKGGLYVTPAIRGGNEFGDSWHNNASVFKKMNTYYDLIDVTNYLIENKWTSPEKVITTGTSNGGLTVSAAAFISPQSFGLVIPVSGVYDVLAINRLDPSFAEGWWPDYGNPNITEERDYIKNYSPLEQDMPTNMPSMLFINGLNDSRVNSLHSIKMLTKIRSTAPESTNIHALFMKNAGHWIASQQYEDYIAVRENQIVWEFIYQQLGW